MSSTGPVKRGVGGSSGLAGMGGAASTLCSADTVAAATAGSTTIGTGLAMGAGVAAGEVHCGPWLSVPPMTTWKRSSGSSSLVSRMTP